MRGLRRIDSLHSNSDEETRCRSAVARLASFGTIRRVVAVSCCIAATTATSAMASSRTVTAFRSHQWKTAPSCYDRAVLSRSAVNPPRSPSPLRFSSGIVAGRYDAGIWHPSRRRAPTPAGRHIHYASVGSKGGDGINDDDSPASRQQLLDSRNDILHRSSRLSLAPMMEYTDRHFRHMVRLISGRTLLYSEMVPANALAHERKSILDSDDPSPSSLPSLTDAPDFDPSYLFRFLGQGRSAPEGASVLQMGGSDPAQLFDAARSVREFSELPHPWRTEYTALNLNCGCPSPKVAGKGCFGAALMEDPNLVAQLVRSMHDGADGTLPVTVKCRIGTDAGYVFTRDAYDSRSSEEEYDTLRRFIETVASDGIATDFQIHARIAVLGKSFSPTANRKVPPLRYDYVRRLVRDFPELTFSLNGGVNTLAQAKRELDECEGLAGVMVGRAFTSDPWGFAMADELLYGDEGDNDDLLTTPRNRLEVLEAYGRHADVEEELSDAVKIRRFITKAASHLFTGEHNAKRFRIELDEIAGTPKKLEREAKQRAQSGSSGTESASHWSDGQPPVSELIMGAVHRHFSEEVLLRSPKESYEKKVWEEEEAERKKEAGSVLFVGGVGEPGS